VVQAPGGKLTQKQELLLAALLTAPGIEAAAKQVGIAPVTAWRWMKLPGFQQQYRAAKAELVQHAVTLLQKFAATAVGTLAGIMVDRTAPASTRVAAARTVLELSLRGIELDDILTRLETMEAALAYGKEEQLV
jgi:hypothetical protein